MTKEKYRLAYTLMGEVVEALFYDADSVTRKKLTEKLNELLKDETYTERKDAISHAIRMLSLIT